MLTNRTGSLLSAFILLATASFVSAQMTERSDINLLFKGVVFDASSLTPIPESQIFVNGEFKVAGDKSGAFVIQVQKRDSVEVKVLGYKQVIFKISDTLSGRQFVTGIYMNTDTLSIGEVVIMPRLADLRSEMLRAPSSSHPEIENARYNLAVSAYQGKISQSILGDPASNYEVLKQRHRIEAYEKGGIPSDKIAGFNPFILVPAAYLLLNGIPSPPKPMKPDLTKLEIDQIHKKYLESSGSGK